MFESDTPDPFVLGRILTLQGLLRASTGAEQLAQTACTGLLRVPGIEDCALCLDGDIVASTAPERTGDLAAALCKKERQDGQCHNACRSWRKDRMVKLAVATPQRTYGGVLLRVSDEEQYALYEPYLDETTGVLALLIEIGRQAAELRERSADLSRQVQARTLELEHAKARLELAIKGGDLSIWDWNIVSGAVSYSERCVGILGYTLKEIEPTVRSWERLVHPEDLPGMREAIQAHLNGKTDLYQSEHRRRHASGKWIWILDRGKVLERDAHGSPLRMCGTHIDITESKEAEHVLELSERRLRLALEAGAMGTWDVNLETGEITWSEYHSRLFGLPPSVRKGTEADFRRSVHPEDVEGVLAEADRCRAQRIPYRYEFRIVWPDDSVHWISARGTFVHNPEGKPARLVGVLWDITERRQAEAERLRLTTAIEHAGESFLILGRGGIIVYVNPAFERTSGYTSQEVAGKRWDLVKPDAMNEGTRAVIWASVRAGKTWSGRAMIKRKDGTTITIECTVSPVLDKKGEVEYMVVVYRDITEQLTMEESLRQVQRLESIGRLAAGVAHDFNNMLTPILGYTEMLLAGMEPADPRYGQLMEVKKAAESSRDLTRQLVAFSRKQVLRLKAVDLREVVSGIEQLLRRTVRDNIVLKTQLSATPCPVAVDVAQVEQVLMNLAVNAQQSMSGGGELTMEVTPAELDAAFCATHAGAKPGRYGALIVSHTGSGMDEEARQHAFEPFYSFRNEQGTGLGLPTVYGIVKQHAGSIWIDSEPAKGARFTIYFPAVPLPLEGQPAVLSRRAYPGTETILLVEDNDMVRKLTESLLRMQGYKVVSKPSGKEALASVEEAGVKADLLLADVVMSDMSGPELSAKLHEKRPKLKVLFMSGYSDDAVEHHGVLEAGTDFIQKPFSIAGLAAKVREVLDRRV